jgi:hypothetical protein
MYMWNLKFVVRFEVITAVTVRNSVFCDVTPCGSCKNRLFGGLYRLYYQGDSNRRTRNTVSDKFLLKVGAYKNHTTSHPTRRHSSDICYVRAILSESGWQAYLIYNSYLCVSENVESSTKAKIMAPIYVIVTRNTRSLPPVTRQTVDHSVRQYILVLLTNIRAGK